MRENEVTRRQLLAGLAGAGGLGAVVGTGTGSLLTDETRFGGSSLTSGSLDLAVQWETDDASGTTRGTAAVPLSFSNRSPTDSVDLTVSLPEIRGGNNPAQVWVRTPCPDDEKLLEALEITLRYAHCDRDCVVSNGSLWGLLEGVPVAPGDAEPHDGNPRCLKPDESIDLKLDAGFADYEKQGSATFGLEFVGVQCRNSAARNPFPTDSECEQPGGTQRPDISFLSFCSSEDEPIKPSVPTTRRSDDPDVAFWETATDVDYVCVKGGQQLTIYDYRRSHRTDGAAWVGDPQAAVSSLDFQPGDAARPCAVANDELGGVDLRQSVTLENERGHWRVTDE